MKFNTLESVVAFATSLVGLKHGDVQTLMNNEGFASYGTTAYATGYSRQTITNDQAIDYLLSADLVVQIRSILYRPKGASSCSGAKWNYILAMTESNTTLTTYADLKNGTYTSSAMNQFATYSDINGDSTMTVESFMANTATGHSYSTAPTCTQVALKPIFGWGSWGPQTCMGPIPGGYNWDPNTPGNEPTLLVCRFRKKYFLGITVANDDDCWPIPGSSCAGFVPDTQS